MSNQLEHVTDRLRGEIKSIEASVSNTAHDLTTAVVTQVEDLEARWKSAVAKYEAKHLATGQPPSEKVRQFLAEKKHEFISKYEDWRTDREIEKLEKHADQTEQRAVDAIVAAAFAVMEAEVATLEALKARKIAIEVAG